MKINDILEFSKIQEIFTHHFDDEILTVDVYVKWIRVKLVKYKTPLILRIWKAEPGDRWEHLMRQEIKFLKYCKQIGFTHVYNMVAYNLDRVIIPYEYYIYEFVEGQQFDYLAQNLNKQQKETLYHNLGVVVGKLHSHKVYHRVDLKHHGDVVVAVKADPWEFNPDNDGLKRHYDQIFDYAETYPQLKPYLSQIKELWDKYAEFRKSPPSSIGLVHFDLAADNIIISNQGQDIDDFHMIDVSFAQISSITMDLARIERRFTVWRRTLELDEIDHYLDIFYNAYETQTPVPVEYHTGEGMIYRLNQLIDDFWMYEDDEWMKNHQEYIMNYTIWELDRMIEEYL